MYKAVSILSALVCASYVAATDPSLGGNWKQNGLAMQQFSIQGTGGRNNPLRRQLSTPFDGDEFFVRYRIRYQADSVDTPAEGDGEFFVLWIDQTEGNDGSTHSSNVPNVGIHVAGDENRFMVRYGTGSQKFAKPLVGDQEFLVVARLWKSSPGPKEPYDQLNLWIDPQPGAELKPDTSTRSTKSIQEVQWIGFSTGAKTEFEDNILVWDIGVASSWRAILKLPPEPSETTPTVPREPTVHFASDVYPILKSRCFKCHAGDDPNSGVRLDVLDEALNQTAPRNASESKLFQLVAQGKMPPEEEKLSTKEAGVLQAWIDEGLEWDEQLLPTPTPESDHWAFQSVLRPPIPKVQDTKWIRTGVDAFVKRKHEELGLVHTAPANANTMQRRLSLDLLGLPPTGTSQNVDELLAHPAYGQRWARHWLDVARWAESNGHQHNRHRPYAWRYRDWVVDAFNNDYPYDRFLRDQIAGDEVVPHRNENLVATGFMAAARYSGNELDKDIQRNDILVDIANTTAKAFLGLTLECAQCHTHKFDPISIRDYYRFQAFFAQGQPANVVLSPQSDSVHQLIKERWEIFDTVHARLVSIRRKQGHPEPIYVIPKTVVAGMKPAERQRFNELDKQIAKLPQSWSYYSPATSSMELSVAPHEMRWPLPRETFEPKKTMLLVRGDPQSRGPVVLPGWPAVFGDSPSEMKQPRLALAQWMNSGSNPLTARVWVNRIWQWHFGRGLVQSSGDFGTQGSPPTHKELLDYLASELIDSGWSTKHIHRLILNSATYRQSSQYSATNAAIDPDNKYLWRWRPRRLEAEAVRDSILAVSGQLDASVNGPSVEPNSRRRSLYLKQRRDNFPHQQRLFDSANGIVSCSRRPVTTTALQPLWLLNSQLIQQAAGQLADRAGSVQQAILLTLGRQASDQERSHLQGLADEYGLPSACLAILNSSEFLYIP